MFLAVLKGLGDAGIGCLYLELRVFGGFRASLPSCSCVGFLLLFCRV